MKSILLYVTFIKKIFKVRITYLGDFVISFILNLVSNLYSLVFINIIFANISLLGHWTLYEVLVIYGINLICKGIFCTFFGELDMIGDEYILEGKLDNLLLRPVSPLMLIMTTNIYEENLTDVFLGLVSLIWGIIKIGNLYTIKTLLILLATIVVGVIIYYAFFLIVCSMAFWFQSRFSLMWTFLDITDYSGYPLDIFPRCIRGILTWIMPFGLVTFYPSIIIMNKLPELHWVGFCIPVVVIVFFLVALFVWNKGLERYESTGN